MKDKITVLHSGGQDSTCMLLEAIDRVGRENVYSIGFDYGQRHFEKENEAAFRICERFDIPRTVLKVPLGDITQGSSLVDVSVEMTTDMTEQRTTCVQLRNMMFITLASAFAIENGCTEVYHGACAEDEPMYRDCRAPFFKYLEHTIQAGRNLPINGSEDIMKDINDNGFVSQDKIDLKIKTPFINEKKEETLSRILETYDVDVFKDTWTCYNGGLGEFNGLSCGQCPACQERLTAFEVNNVKDPLAYVN